MIKHRVEDKSIVIIKEEGEDDAGGLAGAKEHRHRADEQVGVPAEQREQQQDHECRAVLPSGEAM